MIPLLLPILAIGAIAALVVSRRPPQQLPPPPPPPMLTSGAAPSPLVVLDQMVAAGQTPPPFVVACAIAEAEAMGRTDVSQMLFQVYAVPMIAQVQALELAQARDANPMPMPMPAPVPAPAPTWPGLPFQGHAPGGGGLPRRQHAHGPHAHALAHGQGWGEWQGWPMAPGAAPGAPIDAQGLEVPPPGAPTPMPPQMPGQPTAGQTGLPSIADPAYGTRVDIVERPDRPERPPGRRAGASPNEGTITVSGMNSPIADIPNHAWASFAQRVAREQPTFVSPSHLGQYRQNRQRIARLGFDPAALQGSPNLQGEAFAADMADAYQRMSDSGLIAEYCGMTIEIPEPSGGPVPIEVTLSGIMGVAQAAGLEGAVGWLENPADRERFPRTTAAFLRTNGVF